MSNGSPVKLIIGCVVMFLTSSGTGKDLHIKNKIWVVRVYIINGSFTRKKLDDISHRCYFMGYAAITGLILYWKTYHNFFIHRAHHVCLDEYNYHLSIEYKHTTGYLIIQQYPESLLHNLDLLNLIP